MAERVADERCESSPGSSDSLVGYQVRLDSARYCFPKSSFINDKNTFPNKKRIQNHEIGCHVDSKFAHVWKLIYITFLARGSYHCLITSVIYL